MQMTKRYRITGILAFSTAFHLGTGEEGRSASDMGVLLDKRGQPLLPGASLKGVFRTTAERLCHYLGLTTCFLDKHQEACAGGNQDLAKKKLQDLAKARSEAAIEEILQEDLCDVCRLFGSSLARGKLWFKDAPCRAWAGVIEKRDGVGIDRDSGTAVDGVKYDYDVVPSGAEFAFELLGENLQPKEERLVQMVLLEWSRDVRLGGMTSRGMGAAVLRGEKEGEEASFFRVDLRQGQERLAYLLEGTMARVPLSEIKSEVRKALEDVIEKEARKDLEGASEKEASREAGGGSDA